MYMYIPVLSDICSILLGDCLSPLYGVGCSVVQSGFFLEIFQRGGRLINSHALHLTNVCA